MIDNWRIKELKTGTQVHYLTIIAATGEKSNDGSLMYLCQCICGQQTTIQRSKLNGNKNKSCGCLQSTGKQKEPGHVSYKVLHTSYRKRAEKDKRDFTLSFEDFKNIIIQNCNYCNLEPKDYNTYVNDGHKSKAIQVASINRAWVKANGVDRVDPKQGYVLQNCVPCCAQCNYAKSDYTLQEFLDHNTKMYLFQQQKKQNVD